jgi:ribosomal protein S5
MKGGGETNYTALVICGNGDGLAGWAKGKGPKATRAIREVFCVFI